MLFDTLSASWLLRVSPTEIFDRYSSVYQMLSKRLGKLKFRVESSGLKHHVINYTFEAIRQSKHPFNGVLRDNNCRHSLRIKTEI